METINQSTHAETINTVPHLDSNTVEDTPPATEDVETEDSNCIKQSVNTKDHLQYNSTTNETKTTNIELPFVNKIYKNNENDDDPMDISGDDDAGDESKNCHNEVQQVEVSEKPQYQPQNEEDKEHNNVTDEEDLDKEILKKTVKCRYEETKTVEEDELLKSDNDDDSIEEVKGSATTVVDTISMEQEEELLKSEDEEENIAKEKYIKVDSQDEASKESDSKINPFGNKEKLQVNTQALVEVSHNIDKSYAHFDNRNKLKTGRLSEEDLSSKSQNFKQTNEATNHYEPLQPKSENCEELETRAKNSSKTKERKNTENHRILYQFDLDDDSSSQDSFQYKKSPETTEASENKVENNQGDLSKSQPQFSGTVDRQCFPETTDFKNINSKNIKEGYNKIDNDMSEKETEIPYSPSQAPLSESDSAVSDNETDIPSIISPRVISDNEVNKTDTPYSKSTQSSPKSDDLSSDEDCNISEIKDQSSRLPLFYETRVDSDEKYENRESVVDDNSSNNNDIHSNDINAKDLTEKENNISPLQINGGHESESIEAEQNENSNDSYVRNYEETQRLQLRKTSLEPNVISLHQYTSFNINKIEESPNSHNEINKNLFSQYVTEKNIRNYLEMKIESDTETNLKINENSQHYHNNDSNDNEQCNKPSSPLSPTLANEEGEVSRSSIASSASYSSSTSSSQHLVIDHPMDDVIKEEKVKPLKITLKRKLSNLSNDGDSDSPQQKKFNLYEENVVQENTQLFVVTDEKKEEFRAHDVNTDLAENVGQIHQDHSMEEIGQNRTNLASESYAEKSSLLLQESDLESSKSLLLQRLEKPLATLNAESNLEVLALTTTEILPLITTHKSNSPTHLTAPPLPTQPFPTSVTGVTKYLCFKCKIGSFDTFAALAEHQAICLVAHSILPISQTINQTSQLPPISLPFNSPRNSNSLSPTKPAPLTELKEIIAPSNQLGVPSIKKRYYKCSTCNTFHENWNLFLHIREKHNRHMCLYCVRFFPTAEKLALHLEIKHDLEQNHFNSEEALRSSIPMLEGFALESRFLMCCTCQYIFMQNEQFSQHDCSEFLKPCSLCGQKGRHTNQCKAHPDSKRFSKLKKKKEKHIHSQPVAPLPSVNERSIVAPITISNHNINPTINSNLNCDSERADKHQRPPTLNSMPNEDSNSSSNMVIDESCNISHMPPAKTQLQEISNTDMSPGTQPQKSSVLLEPDLPPDRQLTAEDETAPLPPLKLVVPKFKLRVPKEFQKSVYDALSTSDSEEEVDDDELEDNKDKIETEKDFAFKTVPDSKMCITKESLGEAPQTSLLAESTPANSQDMEIERNSTTSESATEAGNSQDDAGDSKSQKSALLLDDDDSLDEPNSNLVRIMQEIERTKLDIQRTKKTSTRHNKPFALPRQPTASQSSNRTADHNWSPTPPASPNSRWFTPRRSTMSQSGEEQLQKTPQHPLFLLPPPSPVKQLGTTQERRDTVGSDMMDIDETITSQPTQTIYRSQVRPLDNENMNTSIESMEEKSSNEAMDAGQTTDNETSLSDHNNSRLNSEKCQKTPISLATEFPQEQENKLKAVDIQPKQNTPETVQNMAFSLTHIADYENNEQKEMRDHQEDEAEDDTEIDVCGNKEQEEQIQVTDNERSLEVEKLPPADGIEVANDDTAIVDMKLDKPIDKYEIVDFVRICLNTVYPLCLYCNHARRIAVNGQSLVLHMIGQHRFTATVDSITAEELLPPTIVTKLKSFLPQLEEHFFNSNSYCTYGDGSFTSHFNERIFECFQCRFVTSTHKELYLHNRKMHLRTAILCFMCRANFFSFSEILCHICPGVPNKVSVFDVKFRCCLCELDNIPSPFRLMVHLRKKHFACDVCLEDCRDQSKLSSHVWKHKLHHLCYRCGIAYRNKLDITKHLFWKHGTESTICKRCLQKKWRHVYHFCIPPTTFVCEVCNLCFSKAMYLRVHKRLHSGDLRYPCIEDNCEEKFISRKLLLKHALVHQVLPSEALAEKENGPETSLENKENEFDVVKDTCGVDVKNQSDLENIKHEVMQIKKEPLDDSEMESKVLLKNENNELAEKKETEERKAKLSGVDFKNDTKEPHKKRKKNKRSKKELLEDLNLAAPNLSESDSSNDSGSDSDTKTKSEIDSLPRVMLSPPSEAENDEKDDKSSEPVQPGEVLEIWKNFLKTQQGSSTAEELERLKAINEESKQPKHIPVHVACSDHDYCKIEPEPSGPPAVPEPTLEELKDDFKKPATELTSTPETSPIKRKQSKSPRRLSSRRSDGSSSSSESSSSSDSSCSCGSNCSCSSSDSNSSSSSSSSEDSDSSLASNNSVRKRHRKKSERDRMRKRSESMSPLKHHKHSGSNSEVIHVDDEDNAKETDTILEKPPSPKEPLIYESDLETNESETDEEFYDEHPQKLATELLAQKRAQLMAQTRLSPSHNYDIVENSRPSTPSLPEEVATNEKPKIKVKKKKRDRKSSCKGLHTSHAAAPEQAIAPAQTAHELHQPTNSIMQVAPNHTSSTLINSVIDTQHTQSTNFYNMNQNIMPQIIYPPPPPVLTEQTTLTPRPLTMPPYGHAHRMSDGSSCSDADGSLKRSKRQRRPNKFYGYTSDDENLLNGPPLMIGTRAFKPQPPPQLTWHKEDLPTPSKSILNNKNKTPRAPKTPATPGSPFAATTFSTSSSKKKSRLSLTGGEKSSRKRPAKKKDDKGENKFPPIPTLKIRPSQIGLNTTINHSISKSSNYNTTDDTSSDDETPKIHFSTSASFNSSAVQQPAAALPPPIVLPSHPPTPQTTAFNHRIPPALLPNPDFATLQYFKANNIRYPIRPPAGARQPREGESVYCYCRCPYDEVSEMIACDGENCLIEWFHFECVGIMVAPQGKWFCAECRPKYSEELYPSTAAGQFSNV